jgi:hypothetical protein
MKRYLRNRISGHFFSKEGTWGDWTQARLFEDVETILQTAMHIDERELDIVLSFGSRPLDSDFSVPIPPYDSLLNREGYSRRGI